MSLRAIVLDFDGVIANSEPLHFQAFRDVLAEEGVTLTEGDYYARYLGFDDVAAFQAIAVACGGAWTTAHIGELAARKAARLESLECVRGGADRDRIRRARRRDPPRPRS